MKTMTYALAILPMKDYKGNPIRVSSDDWCFEKLKSRGTYRAVQPHKYSYGYIPLRKDIFSEFKQEKYIAYRQCEYCLFRQVLEPSFQDFNSRYGTWREENIC